MELKEKLDQIGTAFEEFKKTNDARLAEMKAAGAPKAETEAKLAKLETHIAKLESEAEAMTKALNRTPAGAAGGDDQKALDKKASALYQGDFREFMRSGKDISRESLDFFKKSMSVDSDSDGGFMVSPEMSSEIVQKVFESTPLRELASVQTISSDALEILEDLDEAGSGWVGETESRGDTTTPQIKKITIPVHELYSQPKATQKLLDDAAINIEQWLAGKVASKFSRDEATAFINGDGVKKPMGILSYGAGDGFGLTERVTSNATTLVGDDIISLQTALKEAYQNNATFLMNRMLVGVIRKLKDITSGQYIWQPGLTVGTPNMLAGREVRFAADLPSTVQAATDTILYGDFKAGYQIVDRIGIRVIRDIYTNKPFVLFYTTKRVGGGVKNFEAIKSLKIHA